LALLIILIWTGLLWWVLGLVALVPLVVILIKYYRDSIAMTAEFFKSASSEDVRQRLKAGADLKARTKSGLTPLHWAAESSKSPEVVKALLDAGADLEAENRNGGTPLHLAAQFSKSPEVVKALLDAGADPKAQSAGGLIPVNLIKDDSPLKGTDIYWQLDRARFQ